MKTTETIHTVCIKQLMYNIDITSDEFTRIDNDVNGNPRYVIHFPNIANNMEEYSTSSIDNKYNQALDLCSSIGGKKYHNKSYGGGLVFQSYSLPDTIRSIKKAMINNMFNEIIINGLDLEYLQETNKKLTPTSREKTIITALHKVFMKEYGWNIKGRNDELYLVDIIKNYLQGLPSVLSFEFEDFKILELLGNNNINIFNEKDNDNIVTAYWTLLGLAVYNKFKTYKLV